MKIPVILNDEKVILNADPDEKLSDVLRKLKLYSVKEGCSKGHCGSCSVLLDGKSISSCLVPAGILRNCRIVTLEHFVKTPDGMDIQKGFIQAGVTPCGFCNASRFFAAYNAAIKNQRPDQQELEEIADSVKCTCTDSRTFINGILYAIAYRHEREGRKHGLI